MERIMRESLEFFHHPFMLSPGMFQFNIFAGLKIDLDDIVFANNRPGAGAFVFPCHGETSVG